MTANEPEAGRGPESGYAQEPTPRQEQQQPNQQQWRQQTPSQPYGPQPQPQVQSQTHMPASDVQTSNTQQYAYPQPPVEPSRLAQPYMAYGYPQGMPPVNGQPGIASPYPQATQYPQAAQYAQQSHAPEECTAQSAYMEQPQSQSYAGPQTAYAQQAAQPAAQPNDSYGYPQGGQAVYGQPGITPQQPQYATNATYAQTTGPTAYAQPFPYPYQQSTVNAQPEPAGVQPQSHPYVPYAPQPAQQPYPLYPQYSQYQQSPQGYPQPYQPYQQYQPYAQPTPYPQYQQPGMAPAYGMPYAMPYANPAIAARKALNKWRRAVVNRAMGITFAYEGLMYAGVIIAEIIVMTVMEVTAGRSTMSDAEYNRWTGVFSIASLVTAVGYLLIVRHRDIFTREYWLGGPHLDTYGEPNQRGLMSQYGSGRRMTPLVVLSLIALTMGVQSLITFFSLAVSMLGGELPSPTSESIDDSMTTVSMWLYVSLLAPICEEMIFRGVLMKSLKPLGKNFAIVTTAIMFGFFHGDLVQGLFAALSGLLLGYVAMEYSLVWSIGLHFFNNAVLAGVMDTLASTYLGDNGYAIYSIGIMLFGFIVSAIVLALGHKQIGAYVRANRSAPGTYAGWASWTLIGFMVFNGGQAVFAFVSALLS